jgi:hypothetical protein
MSSVYGYPECVPSKHPYAQTQTSPLAHEASADSAARETSEADTPTSFEDRLKEALASVRLDIRKAQDLVAELRHEEEKGWQVPPNINDLWMRLFRRIEKETR